MKTTVKFRSDAGKLVFKAMKTKQIALITGATSGIGQAYAFCFAKQKYDLIITGRRMDKLNSLARQLRHDQGICVRIVKAELSNEKDLLKLIKSIECHQNICVLVNNAGFGSGMEFSNTTIENHMRMLQVHVVASLKLIYAVLPQMISRKAGTIINVSSLGAFMPSPGNSMYAATKLFLKSFTESLYLEVRQHGVKVQCICPGFTHSDFHERRDDGKILKAGSMLWMKAETVADKSVSSLKKNVVVLVPGILNRILLALSGIIPRALYYRIMGKSGKAKFIPRLIKSAEQLVEKMVYFLFTTRTDHI